MADTLLRDPVGRTIVLHDRTWFGHILKAHPDMESYRAETENAISAPAEIRHSRSDADCRLYFGNELRERLRILAVADVAEGVVKTAHLARRISGGDIEWPS